MKKSLLFCSFLGFALHFTINTKAQLPATKTYSGQVRTVEDGMITVPPPTKYKKLTDSLDENLKKQPNDTTSLFYRSLIYYSYNQLLAEPYQRTEGTLEKLTIAKGMIEKSITLGMKDLRARQLRAQIYAELCYRFTGDENWMFNKAQIATRKQLFNTYKDATNRYFDELAQDDKVNAYDYSKKKVTFKYRL